ncbi:unnamed protein product, partial [Nippostrongylus brasiliensis]|uniref:Myrosinase 1 n=1 Tax=Nippostrongylus brasiliensis TaxID=27835 RepID=A0A0N4XCW2_NIPBR
KWSTATAAFQVEGATRKDGRGPSIWDEYVQKPGKIRDNSTADVACDSYHNYMDDIKLMKALGVSHYRFSLSWPRIFPNGVPSVINRKGLHYYHALIDALKENGIEPMVTLYHWDLPLGLHVKGGWLNQEIVKWFRLYAIFCFREFGDKVCDSFRTFPFSFFFFILLFYTTFLYTFVFVTENGCMNTPGEGRNDLTRIRYLRDHIAAVSKAIADGCNVIGYTVWSLMDNFEWADGYANLFGVHEVRINSYLLFSEKRRSVENHITIGW